MSPEGSKLFVVAALSLILGGVAGAFAMRTVYGGHVSPVDPSPDRPPVCAKCAECPVCPPAVDCGELGVVPQNDTPIGDMPSLPDPVEPTRPGLPASALQLAAQAVKAAVEPCLADAVGLDGNVLLNLTVTATGGQGFIRDVQISKTAGDVGDSADCVAQHARRAKFPYEQSEGELRFQLPIKLSP